MVYIHAFIDNKHINNYRIQDLINNHTNQVFTCASIDCHLEEREEILSKPADFHERQQKICQRSVLVVFSKNISRTHYFHYNFFGLLFSFEIFS